MKRAVPMERPADRTSSWGNSITSSAYGPLGAFVPRRAAPFIALTIALCASATVAFAHDIPRDVTVQAFAKPDGRTLTLLVRVPLKSIIDIEFPRRERDYVDLARVDQSLRDAAMLWVASK